MVLPQIRSEAHSSGKSREKVQVKMAKHDAAALRAARQARIAARTATGDQSDEKNVKPDEKEEEAEAKKNKEATVSATGILTAAILDPASVQKTAQIDLVGYADQEDPVWVVLASGRPVAEIRLSDQEEPQKVAKLFVTEQYAEGVREAAKQFPFEEVLAGVRARTYQASVSGQDAYKAIEAKVRAEADTSLRQARSNLRDNMSNMLSLVVLAQSKNFLRENPLKDELFSRMTATGLDESRSVALIEAAYQARAQDHFDACFKQAARWMDLQPEALHELEEQIKDLGYRQPTLAQSDEIRAASADPAPSGSHNVPLTTRTAAGPPADDEKEQMREAMGFRRRNKNHQMSNR
jgi:hypothetical protein